LQDFWAHDVPPHPEQEALALTHIKAHPGIRLSELLRVYPDLPVDIVWALISQRRVFTDLSATLLTRHEQIILYGEEAEANQARRTSEVPLDMLASVSEFAWDGRLWQIEAMTDPVQLRPEVGETLLLP
jgi:putative transposase